MIRIGVDLGGTKIAACALSDDGVETVRLRVPTPKGDYNGTLRAVVELVREIEAREGAKAEVGIGYPGSVSPRTRLHRNANSTCLNGRDLIGDLSRALSREVRGANDANCLALSEAFDGAARGARVVFAVIVGTGVGGGLVVDRRIIEGHNGIGGEWGHCPLPGADRADRLARPCYCGKHGCTEQFVSGPALERFYAERAETRRSLEEIAQRAADGSGADPSATATIDALLGWLADALASMVNIVDPDAIVLGGGVSNIAGLAERLPALVATRVFSDQFDTPIVRAQFGDASGVRGAARLCDGRE
jgi:fructokinase